MEDLISREAAIKAVHERAGVDGFIDLPQEYVTDAIRALPSVQPERIRGRGSAGKESGGQDMSWNWSRYEEGKG